MRDRESEAKFVRPRGGEKKIMQGEQGDTLCVTRSGDAKFDFKNESRCDIIVSKARLLSPVFQSGHLPRSLILHLESIS